MLLNNRLNGINATINAYQEEIASLQAKVSQLQSHAQEVQGASQAAESALNQIDTAIAMLQAICPDEIATFKAAIEARFNEPLPQLAPFSAEPDTEQDSPAPEHPSDGDSQASEVIETQAVVVDVEPEAETEDESVVSDTPQSVGNGNGNGQKHHLLTYDQLRIVDRPTLIKLANTHNIPNFKTKKRDELASLLDGMVTQQELERSQR